MSDFAQAVLDVSTARVIPFVSREQREAEKIVAWARRRCTPSAFIKARMVIRDIIVGYVAEERDPPQRIIDLAIAMRREFHDACQAEKRRAR